MYLLLSAPIVQFLECCVVAFVYPSKVSTLLLVKPEAYTFHLYPYLYLSFVVNMVFPAPLTIIGEPELAGNGGIQNLAFISHTVYTKRCIIETSGRTGTHNGYLHFQIYKVGVKM